MDQSKFRKIQDDLASITLHTGAFIKTKWGTEYAVRDKGGDSKQTDVDIEAENLMRSRLEQLYPNFGFVVEEGKNTEVKEYNFVIDPIDGTRYFDGLMPMFFTQVAVIDKDQKPLVTAIYNPISDQLFTAIRGQGACINGKIIPPAPSIPLSRSTLAVNLGDNHDVFLEKKVAIMGQLLKSCKILSLSASPSLYLGFNAVHAYINLTDREKPYDYLPRMVFWEELGFQCEIFMIPNYRPVMLVAQPKQLEEIKSIITANI